VDSSSFLRATTRNHSGTESVPSSIDFLLVGPLKIRISNVAAAVGGVKQQTPLAYLCLHANRCLPVSSLIEAISGESPPRRSRKNLQLYVSRLRKLLVAGDGLTRVKTVGDGFTLSTAPERVECTGVSDCGSEAAGTSGWATRSGQASCSAKRCSCGWNIL
jgi:DNA-binding response OmpR family regulator